MTCISQKEAVIRGFIDDIMLIFKIVQQHVDACLWRFMKFSCYGTCESINSTKCANLRRQKIKSIAAVVLALTLCISALSDCGSTSSNHFPKVTQPITDSSETTAETTPAPTATERESSVGTTVLTIAAPI